MVTQSGDVPVLQMVINNLKLSDTGNYRCRSRSEIGDDSRIGSVTVNCEYLVCSPVCMAVYH